MKMTTSVQVVCLAFALTFGLLLVAQANPAAQLVGQLNQHRDNLFKMIWDGLIQKSKLISNFNQTLATIRARYDEARRGGDLDGLDEGAQADLYYRIVIDEVRNLKERFVVEGADKLIGSAEPEILAEIKAAEAQDAASRQQAFDGMRALDEEEEEELSNELEQMDNLDGQLEHLDKEAEMGWGLDADSRARIKNVLGELLAGELKTLASVIVTCYLGGTSDAGALGPAIVAIRVSLKSKALEFVLQSIMDILNGFFGRKLETEMEPINYQLGGNVGGPE